MNMSAILEGRVALVTGVSHDGQIGRVVAKALAEHGTALAICARTQTNVEARAEELRQAGARVLALATSLTDESQVQQLIERTLSEYKRIDILVNLAGGLTRYKPAVEFSMDDWNHELNNNLLSAFLTSRAVFPHMREAGGGGHYQFRACRTIPGQHGCLQLRQSGNRGSHAHAGAGRKRFRDPRQCSGAWAGRYSIEHCRDETQRFEALDQT
jgi:NAD(P)-dependent dehydrogenase (short-subunit alcohol dehydrogenase family)